MNRNLLLGLIAVAFIGGGVGYYFTQNRGGDAAGGDATTIADGGEAEGPGEFRFGWDDYPEYKDIMRPRNREAFLTPHETDTFFGDPQAPVTIVEFFSYACPHCRSFHQGAYQDVLANYVDTGLVKFVKRDYMLNVGAVGRELWAGAGARCFMEQEQSKVFADLMFERQDSLRYVTEPEDLLPVFVDAGLERDQALACMTDPKNMNLVFGRAIRAQRVASVTGTPTLFINGERYNGSAVDFRSLSEAIERALARAN